jgi:hypothetical protein
MLFGLLRLVDGGPLLDFLCQGQQVVNVDGHGSSFLMGH